MDPFFFKADSDDSPGVVVVDVFRRLFGRLIP
jgi:hypothetical protein